MRKRHLLATAIASITLFVSCANNSSQLPENPKDKEEYRDSNGNTWVYNAAMMYWMMSASQTNGGSYYYYPNSGRFTNASGATVTPPPSVSSGIKAATSKPSKPAFGSTGKGRSSAS